MHSAPTSLIASIHTTHHVCSASSSLCHMPFVLVKNELLESELDGIVACGWRAQAAGKLNLELARFTKRSLYHAHLTLGCHDLKYVRQVSHKSDSTTCRVWSCSTVELRTTVSFSEYMSVCRVDQYPCNCTGAPLQIILQTQKILGASWQIVGRLETQFPTLSAGALSGKQ